MRPVLTFCALMVVVAGPVQVTKAFADAPFAPPTPLINADAVKPGPKTVAQSFTLNGVKGTLEKTTFAEVQKRFGGQVRRQGDAGDSLAWLCYDLPAKHLRVWLSAGELHIQGGEIDEVSIWSAPSPANSAECPVPAGPQSASVSGLSPGQAWTAAQAGLGVPGAAKGDWAAYAHTSRTGALTEDDTLVVRIGDGRITHLQASRTTTN